MENAGVNKSNRARWTAVGLQTAPLWGIPIWFVQLKLPRNSWNFPLLFVLGFFMSAAGLAIPLVALLFTRKTPLRVVTLSALRFHCLIAIVGVTLCIAFVIASQFDPPNPTMSNPPAYSGAVLVVGSILFGFVLPLVELVRSLVCGVRSWRQFV